MSEHVERLKQVANLLDETQNGMAAVGVDRAVEYLTSIEQRLAAAEKRAEDAEAAAAVLRSCVELHTQAALAKVERMK